MRITRDFAPYMGPIELGVGAHTVWFAGEEYEVGFDKFPVWVGSGIKRFSFSCEVPRILTVVADTAVLIKLPRKEVPQGYGGESFTRLEPARARIAPEILLMMENQRRNAAKREEMLLAELERMRAKK